jgi:hypothetical protein
MTAICRQVTLKVRSVGYCDCDAHVTELITLSLYVIKQHRLTVCLTDSNNS